MLLAGVAPGADVGGGVLRDPEEEADEDEGERERHPKAHPVDRVVHPGAGGGPQQQDGQQPPRVGQPVVREEVEVHRRGQDRHGPAAVTGQAQCEQPPGGAHIAADGGVEEAPVQRDAAELGERGFGVAPGAQAHLDEFEEQPDGVAHRDDGDVPAALPAEGPEQRAERHAVAQQQVVAGDGQRGQQPRAGHARHQRDGEGAAACLRPAEQRESPDDGDDRSHGEGDTAGCRPGSGRCGAISPGSAGRCRRRPRRRPGRGRPGRRRASLG